MKSMVSKNHITLFLYDSSYIFIYINLTNSVDLVVHGLALW